MADYIKNYFKSVCEAYNLGNIETIYNAPISLLLTQFGCIVRDVSSGRSGNSGENIDLKLWHCEEDVTETEPFAGVEVKKIGGIDARAKGQNKSEVARYGNVILTDNLTWQFWHSGEERMYSEVQLIEQNGGKLVLKDENIGLFLSCIEDFLLQNPVQIRSSNKLAEYMAKHARTIREVINYILKDCGGGGGGGGTQFVGDKQKSLPMFPELYGLYCKIKGDLQPAMTTRDFADMYAQTIVYGLFIARYNDKTPESFDRYEAIKYLQEESDLLKQFFMHIASSGKINTMLESTIDRLCALYRICNIPDLLGHDESKDTIIHFYETFLTYYDPTLRKSLGVFYTPVQAVRYLVSEVDRILVEDFHIRGGLSNDELLSTTVPFATNSTLNDTWGKKEEISVPCVAILDPACGTGSFGAEIIKYIKTTYYSGSREAFYKNSIQSKNGLLSRLIGFEIMMTSYVVAHLKIRRMIDETLGHASDVRLPINIFLTNTLAPPHSNFERGEQTRLYDFSDAITNEAYHADTWKTRRPVKVIIGNPPYLAASTNKYDISAYKTEADGVTDFGERKHWLNDDYVKFFRFSERIINKNKEGILAFVSNNGYLDNPTFRGMRASLLRTFDKIFIVNLHGSSVKKEISPNGGKDENIFDIMQGVSLFIGIKISNNPAWAKVYYSDLWGTRKSKLDVLDEKDIAFTELTLDEKLAYFVPFGSENKESYEKGISVAELFPVKVTGIVSGNDDAAYTLTRNELNKRIDVIKNSIDDVPIHQIWGSFGKGQTAEKIRNDALSPEAVITQVSFHPFDDRWTIYTGDSCGWVFRPREKNIMGHLLAVPTSPIGKNIGLVFARGDSTPNEFSMVFISDTIIDNRLTAAQTAGIASVAPLYLCDELSNKWTPNFASDSLMRLTENMIVKPTSIEVFDYIYGVLHDPDYREQFNEFLKRDFPRFPVVNNKADKDNPNAFYVSEDMFHKYVTAGERLRKLHLMQIEVPADRGLVIEPNTSSDMEIGSIKYKNGVLHLNANKRILGIREDVWNYRICGYQILDKWFKTHKGEPLTLDSFNHIESIAYLLAETIKVQKRLEKMHEIDNT